MDSYDALYKSTKSEAFRNSFSEDGAAGLVRAVDDVVPCHVESAETSRRIYISSAHSDEKLCDTFSELATAPSHSY